MEENVKGNQPISIVDPEAHSILDKDGKWGYNYNFQAGEDNKYGKIAVHYITQSANVLKTILNLIKKCRNVDTNIIDKLIKNFIIENEIIVDLEINKNKGDSKIK